MNLYDLTERCVHDDDESDKHLEARDRRYSCLRSGNLDACTKQSPNSPVGRYPKENRSNLPIFSFG